MSTVTTVPVEPTKKVTENAAHTLLHKALEEMGKAAHFTEAEIIALYEAIKGKL